MRAIKPAAFMLFAALLAVVGWAAYQDGRRMSRPSTSPLRPVGSNTEPPLVEFREVHSGPDGETGTLLTIDRTGLATQGYAAAEEFLGAMYIQGRGVPKDDKAGAEWFRKAADQGVADAQNELGSMYARGQGVPQDYAAAAEWYRKAAQQGDSTAEYNLGWCYENGRGEPKDLKAALDWYTKAAQQGHELAK